MAASIELEDGKKLNPESYSQSASESTSKTEQQSQTGAVLDSELVKTIMSGLIAQMTDKELEQYAKNLLEPQLNAGIEASQQAYETTKMGKEQEIENLAASLSRSIAEQKSANAKAKAGLETAALSRGMGRSSYTLQTLAGQDNALAQVIRQLTEDTGRQQGQIQDQITQAAQQNAATQGRLKTDYASNLAAKIQELRQNQQQAYNQNYMTAVSASLGSKSTYSSTTTGSDSNMSVAGKITGEDSGSSKKKSSGSKTSSGKLPSVSLPDGVDVIAY
ncbi:MAG: hypothetical protein ACI4MM_05000 [Candidatus Ventricola sp.]